MGSPPVEKYHQDRETQHLVRISKPFYLDVKEVTDEEYIALFGSKFPYADSFSAPKKVPKLPMSLSWNDCIMYCNKLSETEGLPAYYTVTNLVFLGGRIKSLDATIKGGIGYRLPTEAEWEYACRAGTITAYHFGGLPSTAQANMQGTQRIRRSLMRGGSFPANAFGLYDMHGNIAEWCFDLVGSNPDQPIPLIDPIRVLRPDLLKDIRVYRGGSCFDQDSYCRAANQKGAEPNQYGRAGFRVARSIKLPAEP